MSILQLRDPNTGKFIPIPALVGPAPVRGVDYWTPVDQESIVQDVLQALGTPVFGRIDINNNITLTGELAEGIYTLWYEDKNGKTTKLCTYNTAPEYTNWLKHSIEADGTPYNGGQGWKTNTRLNSSGVETTSDAAGIEVTGFIPIKYGEVIRFKNITIPVMGADDYVYSAQTYFTIYDADKNVLMSKNLGYLYLGSTNTQGYGLTLDGPKGNIIEMRTNELHNPGYPEVDWRNESMAFFRISCEEINDNSIITINQEIPEEEESTYTNLIPLAINSDGSAFVGANGEKGYKAGYRLNSSSTETAMDGMFVTGFIPVKQNDVVRLSGIEWGSASANAGSCYLHLYQADFTKCYDGYARADDSFRISGDEAYDADGNLMSFTLSNPLNAVDLSTVAYMRLSSPSITADSIITANEEIPESGGSDSGYTNQIPISTVEDGNILNGVGYVEGYRIDSSGALVAASGISTTGYIPCKNGDILRGSAGIIGDNTDWTGIVLYDENKTWIASIKQEVLANSSKWIVNDNSSFYLDTTAAPISEHGDFSYIRFHSQHISDNGMIITVNEDIEGVSGPSSTSYTNLANPLDSNWILDKRYNSSYVLTDYTGGVITNYIDVSGVKEYIAIKGINMKEGNGRIYSYPSQGDTPANYVNTNASSSVIVADYDSSVFIIPASMFSNSTNYLWRFGGFLTDLSENVVITIDEEIR